MKKIAIAAAVLAVVSAPALAQDKSGTTYQSQPRTTAAAPEPVYQASSTSTASTYSDNGNTPLSGMYLGAYGGYGWTDADISGVAGADDIEMDGADYGLFVGYKLDRFLQSNLGINGAIEAFYGWSDQDEDIAAGVTVEKDHEWGINFRPGMSFLSFGTAINPYGIIGYRNTQFSVDTPVGDDDDNYSGFDLGIGTELVAYGNVGIRLDYTHTFYEEKNGLDPDEDNVRVGVAYHF